MLCKQYLEKHICKYFVGARIELCVSFTFTPHIPDSHVDSNKNFNLWHTFYTRKSNWNIDFLFSIVYSANFPIHLYPHQRSINYAYRTVYIYIHKRNKKYEIHIKWNSAINHTRSRSVATHLNADCLNNSKSVSGKKNRTKQP